MERNKQSQKVGDNSTSIQAGGNVKITQGVSYSEAKEIALDVFKSNFYQLSEEAAQVAKQRAEELTDAFLVKIMEQSPDSLKSMNQPDMQYALFTAQKEFARNGDKDLFEMLVDLLVERSTTKNRSLKQIVLNESLEVASKLTIQQINTLSIALLIKHSITSYTHDIKSYTLYINKFYVPFITNLSDHESDYQHLEYSGCAIIRGGVMDLVERFRDAYPGLFTKGFTKEEISEVINLQEVNPLFIRQALHDPGNIQISVTSKNGFSEFCNGYHIVDNNIIRQLEMLQTKRLLANSEVATFLKSLHPSMEDLFNVWEQSSLKSISLTSVGIAIGNANIKRQTGTGLDLEIWIK
jgi:hypothetical protein